MFAGRYRAPESLDADRDEVDVEAKRNRRAQCEYNFRFHAFCRTAYFFSLAFSRPAPSQSPNASAAHQTQYYKPATIDDQSQLEDTFDDEGKHSDQKDDGNGSDMEYLDGSDNGMDVDDDRKGPTDEQFLFEVRLLVAWNIITN